MASPVLTVLLVDDNLDILTSYAAWLRDEEGFHVLTAANGAEGLQIIAQQPPDCVVIDVMMPELNGYQLVRALRGDPVSTAIPLIILTALTQEKDRLAGIFSGVDQYLVKPVKPGALAEAIRAAMTITADEREARWRTLSEASEPLQS